MPRAMSICSMERGDTGLLRHALVHQLLDGFDGLVVRHLRIRRWKYSRSMVSTPSASALSLPRRIRFSGDRPHPTWGAVGEVAEVAHLGGHQHLVLRPLPGLKGLAHQLFTGLFFAAGAVVGPSGVDVTAAASSEACRVSMPTSWPRLFSMVSGISPWPMAVVENGPRLRNNAMVIPFNSNETVCVRFQRKQNAGFTARRTSRHPTPPNEPPKPEPPPEPKLEKSPPESADGAAALMVELMSASPEFSCEPRSENPPANDVPP